MESKLIMTKAKGRTQRFEVVLCFALCDVTHVITLDKCEVAGRGVHARARPVTS